MEDQMKTSSACRDEQSVHAGNIWFPNQLNNISVNNSDGRGYANESFSFIFLRSALLIDLASYTDTDCIMATFDLQVDKKEAQEAKLETTFSGLFYFILLLVLSSLKYMDCEVHKASVTCWNFKGTPFCACPTVCLSLGHLKALDPGFLYAP